MVVHKLNRKSDESDILRISFSDGIPSRNFSFSEILSTGLGYFAASKGKRHPVTTQQVGSMIEKHDTLVARFCKPLLFFRLIERAGKAYRLTSKGMDFFADYQHAIDPKSRKRAAKLFKEILHFNSELSEEIIPALAFGFGQIQLDTRESVENRILSITHHSTDDKRARSFAGAIVDALDFANVLKLSSDGKSVSFSNDTTIPVSEDYKSHEIGTKDSGIPIPLDATVRTGQSDPFLTLAPVQVCININLPADKNTPELTREVLNEVRRFLDSVSERDQGT